MRKYDPKAKPPIGALPKAGHPLAKGLIFCMPFNEGCGPPKDLILPSVDATSGQNWGTSSKGLSLHQDATSNDIDFGLPSKLAFTETSSWTIYVACSIDGGAGAARNIIRSDGFGGSPRHGLALQLSSANVLNSFFGIIGGTTGVATSANTQAVNNTVIRDFVHVRDVANDQIKLYIDGLIDTTASDASTGSWTINANYFTSFQSSSEAWNGRYYFIYIWDRVLTAEEIAWIYKEPFALFGYPTVKSYFFSADPLQTITVADDLNSPWQDSALPFEAKSQTASDNLNNWSDVAAVDFLVATSPQTITINDRIDKPKGSSSNTTFPSWVDGVNLVLLPDGPLQIGTNDLNSFNDDSVVIGIGLQIGDNAANLNDAIFNIGPGFVKEAFDSMFFNNFDSASVIATGIFNSLAVGDTLNNWADSALMNNAGNPIPPMFDTLNLADTVAVKLSTISSFTDTLVLSDAALLNLNYRLNISDDANNLSDAAVVATGIRLEQAVADALSMSDAVTMLPSTSTTNYLRRYLNDVVN